MNKAGQMYLLHLLAKDFPRGEKQKTIHDYCVNMILWEMKIKSIEEKFNYEHKCKEVKRNGNYTNLSDLGFGGM